MEMPPKVKLGIDPQLTKHNYEAFRKTGLSSGAYLCIQGLLSREIPQRLRCGYRCRHCGPSACHCIRHCKRREPHCRSDHGRNRRFHCLCLRRIHCADRRSDRSLHRNHLQYHTALWIVRACHSHIHGRMHSPADGFLQTRHCHQIHPLSYRGRVHCRYRRDHILHTDARFLRIDHHREDAG